MSRPPSITRIKGILAKLDPNLKPDDKGYRAAIVMLASGYAVGPNIKRIAKYARYPRREVAEFSKRLRKNGIWRGGRVYADWEGKNGGVEFWLNVSVAMGYLLAVNGSSR